MWGALLGAPVVAVAGGLLLLPDEGRTTADAVLVRAAVEPSTPVVEPPAAPSPRPKAKAKAKPKARCTTATGRFLPTSIAIPDVDRTISVLALPRDVYNVPGVPPHTSGLGKTAMAFDLGSGIRPGDRRGNALLNAHTYPDGSALGNKLLAELDQGDRIVVRGPLGKLCYRVVDREEVPADDRGLRYFAKKGPAQIAILVCSGKRLGPGQWTKRTIWYATPGE